MKKVVLAILVLAFCIVPLASIAVDTTDDLAVNITALPAFVFNVVEDSVQFDLYQGQSGLVAQPFSMEISGGGMGTARIYVAAEGVEPAWPNFIAQGALKVKALDNIGPMRSDNVEIVDYGAASNGTEQFTQDGFTFPIGAIPTTVSCEVLVQSEDFFGNFGVTYEGTVTGTIHFFAELL